MVSHSSFRPNDACWMDGASEWNLTTLNESKRLFFSKCTVAKECRNAGMPCFLLTTRVQKKVKLR